ncbi:MAG: hypothetical protein JST87_10230 [Bacteroidetes bacterium]|nr:hypothetical protein [Bacteroidota bacterium]
MKEKIIIIALLYGILISCKQPSAEKANPLQKDTTQSSMQKDTTQSAMQGDTLRNKNPLPDYVGGNGAIVFGEAEFIKPKKMKVTDKLQQSIAEKIKSAETVDFTGDKIPDYICKSVTDSTGTGTEYWVSSDYKIIKKKRYVVDGYCYRWFINLDEDPEPEIYEDSGDEELEDNMFIDQNLITGKDTPLLYINPIIIDDDITYWGFPKDISNMMTRKNGTRIELVCSLNHHIINDHIAADNIDSIQSQIPVVFFMGNPKEKFKVKGIKNDYTMYTLRELIGATRK